MNDDRSNFDPRFDPAFQRGFRGGTQHAAPAPARPRETAAAPLPDREPTPTVQQLAQEQQFQDDAGEDAPRRGANPFLIALGALSILLILAGVTLLTRLESLFADSQSAFGFVVLQSLIFAAPIAIGLGAATGIGVLFVFAVRWGRSN